MRADERAKGLSRRRGRRTRSLKSTNAPSASSVDKRNLRIQLQNVSISGVLEMLKPHDHLCLVYESPEEWRATAIPFVSIGLKRGEKCIYIVDSSTADEIRKYLSEEGIDVVSVENTGQLSVLHQTETYTREGSFDPDRMIALLISETEEAITEGYQALRVTGEMTWVLRGHPGSEKLLEYEAKLNSDFFPYYPCLATCQYDRWKFDPEIIKGVVMTHPLLIRGNRVYHNFYYVPPEEFLDEKRAEREVQHWLNNLEREHAIRQSLHESESRYYELFNNMSSGVAVYKAVNDGQDFIFVDFNRGGEEIDNIRRDEVIGKNVLDAFPGVRDFGLFEVFQRVWQTGEPERYPVTFYQDNRVSGWRDNYVYKLPSGELVAVYDDITQQKKIEEELIRREEFLENIIKHTPNAMWISDDKGNVIRINQALRDMLKITDEQIIGNYNVLKDTQVIEQGLLPLVNSVFEKGKTVNFTIDYYTEKEKQVKLEKKEHKILEITMSAVKGKGGKVINAICLHRDITALKQAENDLRESEEKYRTLFETMAQGVIYQEKTGKVISMNLAAGHILGVQLEQIADVETINKNLRTIHEDGSEYKAEHHPTMVSLKTGKPVKDAVMGVYHPQEDNYRWILINTTPQYKPGEDKPYQVFVTFTDITERKRAEAEREQFEQKAQLASRLASVGEMAAGVAHEINNPLTGVIGYAQLLMARKDIPPDIRKDLEAINDSAQRVAGIIQRLLIFSRQTRPERKLVDINELVENTLVLRAYHLRVNNIEVVTHLSHEPLLTMVDPGQIQQVLLNLIVNTETEMKLANGKGVLTITTEKNNEIIKIYIQDNGPGIKAEIIDRIFDPFFTTREAGQGTGLGLSLCYGIVAEHNGKIYAESKLGEGAIFIVELPVIAETRTEKPDDSVATKYGKKVKARILVVDDEKVVRDVASRVLNGAGYTVETVDNAIEALRKIESRNYDLVLMDIKMPGISGTTLYKHIKKIDESFIRRVIFITGDIMGEDTKKFLARTKVAHLEKPFDAKQLLGEVDRVLNSIKSRKL